jgi:hypothetical protein
MAPSFDTPELEGEASPESVLGGDHLRAREVSRGRQPIQPQSNEVGDKKEESTAAGVETTT